LAARLSPCGEQAQPSEVTSTIAQWRRWGFWHTHKDNCVWNLVLPGDPKDVS